MIRDRRTKNDRRTDSRYAVQIEIEWESIGGKQGGTISDISDTGCFVLCSGAVEDGENVKLYLSVEEDKKTVIWGEVVNHVYEIGFAARFIELGASERLFLDRLISRLTEINVPTTDDVKRSGITR